MECKSIYELLQSLRENKKPNIVISDEVLADCLEDLKYEDEEKFFAYLKELPINLRAKTIVEFPTRFKQDLIEYLSEFELSEVINQLESDEATDFIQLIAEFDAKKEKIVFEHLGKEHQKHIQTLRKYSEDEAGSLMQYELFSANLDEKINDSLNRLRRLKSQNRQLSNIHYVFVVDKYHKLLKVIAFEDLILIDVNLKYRDILEEFKEPITIKSKSSVDEAIWAIEENDISILPIVDDNFQLLGRITHDDIIDTIQEKATKQMYSLASVSGDEEVQDSILTTTKSRALWLFINLINISLVSIVIGFFEETLHSIVALAILMPIVANMAGNASMQTLTVMVRQIAMGEVESKDVKGILIKESVVSIINGVIFSIISGIFAYVRFNSIFISFIMAIAMFSSFLIAGVIGATTPIILKKFNIDPAIASSVIILTLMDVIGFSIFLWFATIFIQN